MQEARYSQELLEAIYELGCLYLEMGYLIPAEKIFAGLAAIDDGKTPSKLGLGIIKLEEGLPQESSGFFREEMQEGRPNSERAKLGVVTSFLAAGEIARAYSMLEESVKETPDEELEPNLRSFRSALLVRCRDTSPAKT